MRIPTMLVILSVPLAALGGAHPRIVTLTDSLGPEIDASEQARYHLFPDVEGFVSARLMRTVQGDYHLHYVTREPKGERTRRIDMLPRVVEQTRLHARFVERFQSGWDAGEGAGMRSCAKGAFLLLASRGEYDAARRLADAALCHGEGDDELVAFRDTARQLAESRGLFLPGSLYDRSGRTELLVFSGYYGLWLGIALPMALEADNAEQTGVSLLVIPTASLLLASRATRHASTSDGRAGMITLAGHLGTWQGLGWAACEDREGHDAVGIGALAGIAGIGAATLLSRGAELTPGHAEIANSGLPWGAWLGTVLATLADHEGNDILRDMLIGSDVGVVGCYLAGRGSPVSRARVRFCNMAGVLGGV